VGYRVARVPIISVRIEDAEIKRFTAPALAAKFAMAVKMLEMMEATSCFLGRPKRIIPAKCKSKLQSDLI
jgi:hypothetical protein